MLAYVDAFLTGVTMLCFYATLTYCAWQTLKRL